LVATDVLGVGALYFVIAALAYAVTRSGVRVTFHVPLSLVDEVLLGLGVLTLSALIVFCGAVAACLQASGVPSGAEWTVAIGATVLVAIPVVKRAWTAAEHEVSIVAAKRDARAGLPPREDHRPPGRHAR
jgi:hypothetical protein